MPAGRGAAASHADEPEAEPGPAVRVIRGRRDAAELAVLVVHRARSAVATAPPAAAPVGWAAHWRRLAELLPLLGGVLVLLVAALWLGAALWYFTCSGAPLT